MPWKRTATVQINHAGYAARQFTGISVFRGAQSVFGWRKDSEKLAWTHDLPNDELFGMKRLAATPGSAITLCRTPAGTPKSIVWLDPATGAVQHEHTYTFEPSQNGFSATGDWLFLHGKTPERRWALLRISAQTGELLDQGDAPQGSTIHAVPGRLYLSEKRGDLFHSPVERVQWTQADVTNVTNATLWHHQLYFFVAPSTQQTPWQLAWWDATEGRPMGQVSLEPEQALIINPGSQASVVMAHTMDLGLWIVDFEAGTCRWKLAPTNSDSIQAVCWTPHGPVVAIKPQDAASRLELRDPASGEIRETLPSTRYDVVHLYWLEDRLVASAVDGLDAFAWEG